MEASAASKLLLNNPTIQTSKLLPALFDHIDEERRLTVFHVGPALSDTVDFFANYRCRLHFVDLFSELPIVASEDTPTLQHQFEELLSIPPGTELDICLFWDLFNFLDSKAIEAFLCVLRPHLTPDSLAHAFSVHNVSTPQCNHLYGISQFDTIRLGKRVKALPGYAPQSQRQLKETLNCFRFERSVLLPDSRLELLMQARL